MHAFLLNCAKSEGEEEEGREVFQDQPGTGKGPADIFMNLICVKLSKCQMSTSVKDWEMSIDFLEMHPCSYKRGFAQPLSIHLSVHILIVDFRICCLGPSVNDI